MPQKLSKRALAAKRKRDLAAANSPRRKKMRAENQRKRRKAIKAGKNIEGKDYDHTKKRFVSMKANRSGHGRGTRINNCK
jgi:predicted secreted Zn-dependent protease|tara:strand:- start:3933 stop:4172 length:240 start_codon:yes stop_codon:yes gene_type:complete